MNILYIYKSIKKYGDSIKMAFLLLLHEKMRLQRKVNKLTLRQTQLSHRKDRITKNIERVQKLYSKKQTQLEKTAQIAQSQFSNNIRNSMGLGTQGQMFNPMASGNYLSGGLTTFVINAMQGQLYNNNQPLKDGVDFTDTSNGGLFSQMMTEYMQGSLKENTEIKDGKTVSLNTYGKGEFTKEQYEAFTYAMTNAQMAQQQANWQCQQISTNYQSNVSIWLEAQQEALEQEQNEVLLPLEMEETDIDLDMESCETQLEYAKARLENIKSACSDGIKNSAPTFGLG